MTPLLFEQSQNRQVALEVTGTSGSMLAMAIEPTGTPGSTLVKKTALAMLLLGLSQINAPALAALPERRYLGAQTLSTAMDVMCLKVTEADLFSQLNRVYESLLKEQIDLDIDVRRIVYGSMWDLYS